jgi:hypothetical protein
MFIFSQLNQTPAPNSLNMVYTRMSQDADLKIIAERTCDNMYCVLLLSYHTGDIWYAEASLPLRDDQDSTFWPRNSPACVIELEMVFPRF